MSSERFDVEAFRAMFPEEPLDGPARKIFQFMLMARPEAKSCAAAIKEAIAAQYPVVFPPGAPEIVIPEAVRSGVSVEPLVVPGLAGGIPCLVCRAVDAGPFPLRFPQGRESKKAVVVYFHGGGWAFGNTAEAELVTRKLALVGDCVVISVDYRLAPEHPFPAGLEDAAAVYAWARREAGTVGGDPERVAVGGDSAGGNLAAALVLRLRDEGGRAPDAMLLFCPLTDMLFEKHESFRRYAARGLLYDAAYMAAVRSFYVPYPLWEHPQVSPVLGDWRGGPPTLIVAAGADPLLDDNRAFYERLQAAGNREVELREFAEMPHSFYYFLGLTAAEDEAYRVMGEWVGRKLRA
jgi:acetyl esterase